MKRLLMTVAAVTALGMGLAATASAEHVLSPGCEQLATTNGGGLFASFGFSPLQFAADERISGSAAEPAQATAHGLPTTVTLYVDGAVVATASFPGTAAYTIPTPGTHRIEFGLDSGVATWDFDCTGAPDVDSDADGVNDPIDNCPSIFNPGQQDNDGDAKGDVCDADDDNDNVADTADNCATVANADQLDADSDGKGAACDTQELPVTRDDCMNDGWKRFDGTATFANLGECMRFVASGGKNPPNH